jgi:2-polyprenyl-3-methyl-5-hydroxy-6-metoxy-1,4-benzoquinol methylase
MTSLSADERCFICNEKINAFKFGCYSKCQSCGLIRTEYFHSDERDKFYPKEYYGKDGVKFISFFERIRDLSLKFRARKVKKYAIQGSRSVLDIGCGNGRFLSAIAPFGYRLSGVELPGEAFDAAQNIPGINLVPADKLSDDSFKVQSFSAIVVWHVLEHVSDPPATLRYCSRWLHNGGFLFIEVPNIESWQACLFGDKWLHLDYPRHRFHFTPRSLKLLLGKAGFSVINESTYSFEMSFLGALQSTLNLFIKPANLLYNSMHRGGDSEFSLKRLLSILLGIMLFPVVLIFTFMESCFRRGSVISYVCKLQKVL